MEQVTIINPPVAFDTRMIRTTGIGGYIRNLLQQYSELHVNNAIMLLAPKGDQAPGFTNRICSSGIYGLAEQIEIPLKSRHSKLLHVPHYNAPLLFPGKLVVTIHDLHHLNFYNALPTLFHKLYAKYMMALVVKRADAIMTDSDYSRDDIIRHWPSARPKITTVYCGINKNVSPVGRDQLDRTLSRYRITKPYILYVGMLKSHKNVKRLIAAFEKAQTELNSKYSLVIAGDTKTDQDNIPEWIIREKIGSAVLLTGYVPAGDLSSLYTGATAFVFPSLAEGFGLPPLEAMFCGIPVAASNATCLPEILGDAPCYFDPYDIADIAAKLVISCTDGAWRAQAIQEGHRVAARYDWRQTARGCIEVYQSALGTKL